MKNYNYSNCNMQNRNFSDRCRTDRAESASCHDNGMFLKGQEFPVGMAYVPWSKFQDIYEPERGLNAGTIFADLDKPFLGRRAFCR